MSSSSDANGTVAEKSDRIQQLAWNSFAAYVNSGGDAASFRTVERAFTAEPTEDDYVEYLSFLSEVGPAFPDGKPFPNSINSTQGMQIVIQPKIPLVILLKGVQEL